ncbi:hypothetical protein PAXRUDRAFT_149349 [Paxillus rubicundulus Ve08.2h10]|uniref:Unplaced genomic scaffold scaffold_557, whole genome shotgun sequence n=1 Tax=Paxillus rubicundulus Ve08.2h10 TaxID=930991 RepID=A0A0D0DT06_9AGAM|nr:hypothetical protein PAXRUDRAFT_149349 [Paxillus rubicundulus Ve08.2h10]
MYCDCLSEQLAAQEESQKKRKKGQLNGDRLPRLLTSNEFYNCVVEHQKNLDEEKMAQENHRRQRQEQSGMMATWKGAEETWKKQNQERQEVYCEVLRLWIEE